MRKRFKRYRAFIIMILVQAVVTAFWPPVSLTALKLSWQSMLEMLSVMPPIFILLGLLDVWVDRSVMMKYTGRGSGIRGALIAFLIGSAAAGPLYAAFPVAAVMLKKGSSWFNVFIFIGAWSSTKIPMLTFEAANLGVTFMLLRLALSIIGITLIAALTERVCGSSLPGEKEAGEAPAG